MRSQTRHCPAAVMVGGVVAPNKRSTTPSVESRQHTYRQVWRRGRRENRIVCHCYCQRVTGGLRTAALCVVAVAATSCTNAVSSGTTSTTRTTSTIDAADPRPLITETSLDLMAYWNPTDLSNVYVYPDRSVIVVSRKSVGRDAQTLGASRFTLDQAEFDKVVQAARDAGLVGGGVPPAVSLPPGVQVADGSRGWYSFREGDTTSRRVVDQPGYPMDGTAARTAFAPLVKIMSSLGYPPRAGSTDVPLTRWVITATPTSNKAVPEQKWNGPDISTLTWEQFGNVQCTIVERNDWPLDKGELFVPYIVLDGKEVSRRPLLPHETNCAQVIDLRRQLKPVLDSLRGLP